jgi:hypothetical protein
MPAPVNVLFVSGTGHCGSTLLDRLLTQLGFASVGELRHAWKFAFDDEETCGCGGPLGSCAFWAELRREAFGAALPAAESMRALHAGVDRTRHVPALLAGGGTAFRERLARYGDVLRAHYAAAARHAPAGWVVDTSKNPSTLLVLRRVPGLRLLNLHLVRDSRRIVQSFRKHRPRPDLGRRHEAEPTLSPLVATLNWCFVNAALDLSSALVPTLRLRWEQVVAEPRAGLERVLAFCGAPPPPSWDFLAPEGARLDAVNHGIHGNVGRFDQGRRVRLAQDESWRAELGPAERLLVLALSGPQLLRYGFRP